MFPGVWYAAEMEHPPVSGRPLHTSLSAQCFSCVKSLSPHKNCIGQATIIIPHLTDEEIDALDVTCLEGA